MIRTFTAKAALCGLALVVLGGCSAVGDLGMALQPRQPVAITDDQTFDGKGATGETPVREDYAPELQSDYAGRSFDCGTSVFVGGSGYCLKDGL